MGARDPFVTAATQLYWATLREFLPPPPVMACAAWADKFREIVKGPERGPWRTSRTPYLALPMACTDPEHPAQKVVMQFATQLGKSEVLYNAIFKRIHLAPADMMFVQPTLQDAKDHSRQRFMPTARKMPAVAARLPRNSSRDETNTWQTKEIEGGATMFFSGANSARSLASKPLGFAACDEVDGYPLDVDGEGDPLSLIWERMSNFPRRKILLCSTPTTRDYSRIESEYLASDRCQYHVPCPHCGTPQVLVWTSEQGHGIRFLKTPTGEPRPETAVYICAHCAAAITEINKPQMLADGQWLADNPGAQGGLVVGFKLSKLYSPLGWKSWSMIVTDWAAAQAAHAAGDDSRLKAWTNTSLAETWQDAGDGADHLALRRRAAELPLGVVNWGLFVCTMGVDVQGDRLEAYIWAWGRGMERQLVDRRVFYGDPALNESEAASPWAELTQWRRSPILHASGRQVPLLATMIDSGGHHTQAVYAYARQHQYNNVHACKGSSLRGKAILGKPTEQDVTWRGVRLRRGVKLWPLGTDTAKAEIYGRLRLTEPGPGYVHLSKLLPEDVFQQITAERMQTRYVKGHPVIDWIKPNGRRNEALDCAVYALAAAHYANVDKYTMAEWARRQADVETRDLFDTPPAVAAPQEQSQDPTPVTDTVLPLVAAPRRQPALEERAW